MMVTPFWTCAISFDVFASMAVWPRERIVLAVADILSFSIALSTPNGANVNAT
jgi:hypothetical protein